jgi:hypothetical protein
MTLHHITPRRVLERTIRPAAPTSDAPVHLVSNATAFSAAATWIAELQRRARLEENFWDDQRITVGDLLEFIGDALTETKLEHVSRTHPGMIGALSPECEFAKCTE